MWGAWAIGSRGHGFLYPTSLPAYPALPAFLPAFFAAPFFFGVVGFDFARGAFFAAFLATLATFFLDLALVAGRFFVVLEEVLAAMKIPEKV